MGEAEPDQGHPSSPRNEVRGPLRQIFHNTDGFKMSYIKYRDNLGVWERSPSRRRHKGSEGRAPSARRFLRLF